VIANKVDASRMEAERNEFYRFGFQEVYPVSAEQGLGVGDLLDALVPHLKEAETTDEEKPRDLRSRLVGRNVGISVLNSLW